MCCGCTCSDCILYFLGFLIPPVAVLLRSGCFSLDLLLNTILTCLGVLPGIVHAFYYIHITSPLRHQYGDPVPVGTLDRFLYDRQRLDQAVAAQRLGGSGPMPEEQRPLTYSSNSKAQMAPPPYNEHA
ncbi:ACL024Wp [Eremothecium gossypii ATCC 10895]|uniref:ACL024Wp n=1 Tax=Eremothecium gossypii (strain ATCC 10895 / CBS 109.51 / FGSC 9923 / NRRL Y-1056) TaxID=284811 RepID=Q75CD3_EREGS|nr:ACL024Wp [Eremothecium gossypii ATCC 10895]AAS51204.1 ACL024Wp [Eremothecium gossypii ATCC 10895]AEY95495.1 FACL024Wp [Eremothecium gossypii FDAG1]